MSWRPHRLKYATCINGAVLPEDTDPDFAFQYIDISSVKRGEVDQNAGFTTFAEAPSRARRLAQPGDVVVSTVRTYLRAVATVPEFDHPAVFSTGFAVFHPLDEVDARFLAYFLRSDGFVERVVALSTGVSYPAITPTRLGAFDFLLPSLDEQAAIADRLDAALAPIDRLIAKQSELLSRVDEYRVARTERAVQAVASESRATRLKYVADIQTGLTLGGSEPSDAERVPYLRVANVQTGGVDLSDVKTVAVTSEQVARYSLRAGDVLMTEGGDIDKLGRGCLWQAPIDPCLHQNHVFAVRPGSDLLPEFLAAYLETAAARIYFRTTARKTTNLASTNKSALGALPLMLPGLSQQEAVTADLAQTTARLEAIADKTRSLLHCAQERRTALINELVQPPLSEGAA